MLLPHTGDLPSPIAVSEEDVAQAVQSFPNGSAGGPDGLRPQHLKDMISPSANGGRQALLSALTPFIRLVLEGDTPTSIRPYFFGANLVALRKEDGGVRPIAVGCTLCRLVTKVVGRKVMEEMGTLLAPRQLGYGVKGGAEAAVHAARLYLHNLDPSRALLSWISAMLSTPSVGTRCWRLCRGLPPSCFVLFTQPTPRHLPSSGVTRSFSHQRECSRVIPLVPSFSV